MIKEKKKARKEEGRRKEGGGKKEKEGGRMNRRMDRQTDKQTVPWHQCVSADRISHSTLFFLMTLPAVSLPQ